MEAYQNELVVRTVYEHIQRMMSNATEEAIEKFLDDPANDKQINMISEIISVEVAYYVCRRTGGVDGSTVDTLARMRFKMIKKYEKKFGKWIDFNKDVDF